MGKLMSFIVFLAGAMLCESCATIFNGSTQTVTFTSDPPNAEIYINGENTYELTPATIEVPRKVHESFFNRKNEQYYIFKKEGYHDFEYRDYRQKSNVFFWTVMNVISSYGVGFWVDLSTQAWNKYSDQVSVQLFPDKEQKEQEVVYIEKETHGPLAYQFQRLSDVDKNIPQIDEKHANRFALIIGNEDYQTYQISNVSESNVPYARNDASAFKEYAIKTLGMPERNVIFLLDATSGKMHQAISKLALLAKNTDGKGELYVYYAGHGMMDEETLLPYLVPVDVNGTDMSSALQIGKVYERLTEFPARKVTFFIDACFSGNNRGNQLMAVRGVGIKPKDEPLRGNLVVFSASHGAQSALSYEEQKHGLFTYYLLKKLQQSQGALTYEELAVYIHDKVGLESVLINSKEQVPQVSVSEQVAEVWRNWRLK